MPFIPAPASTVKIEFIGRYQGEHVANVFHGIAGRPVDLDMANQAFDCFAEAFVTIAAPWNANENYFLDQCIITNIAAAGGAQAISTRAPAQGVAAGEGYPNNVAAGITWRTAVSGKSGRGRTFLTGVDEDATDGANHVDPAHVVSLQAGADAFLASMAVLPEITLAVASYYTTIGGVPNQPRALAVVNPITSGVARSLLRTQRRRMPNA